MSKKLANCLTGLCAVMILALQPFGLASIANEDINSICPPTKCHKFD